MNFNLKETLKFLCINIEGEGISDDKDDRGGVTKYGIASNFHPEIDVRNLTLDGAIEFYENLWNSHKMDNFPFPISILIFDMIVNSGSKNTYKTVQKTINDLRNDKIVVDGIFGKNSKKAFDEFIEIHGIDKFYLLFIRQRLYYYTSICRSHKNYVKFLPGWINRINKWILYIEQHRIYIKNEWEA